MSERKKVVVIGLDAWAATLVERLVDEGTLPNVKRLIDRGSYGRLAPFWPCATGNNWASIITGASPAIHQCDFTLLLPGRRLDEPQLGFSSRFCQAEQLWQAASRENLTSVIFDYPQSYPVNADRVIHVGEDGCPDNSLREVFFPWGYATSPSHRRWREVMSRIELRRPEGWKGLPGPVDDFLEATLELQPGVRSERPARDRLYMLLEKDDGGAFDRVSLFTRAKDYARPLGSARPGQWTDWIKATVKTTTEPVEVAFRAKLMHLDPSGRDVHLYLSQGYPVRGFTHPPELSEELVEAYGPYHHHGHTQEWVFFGACDLATHLEQAEAQATWFRGAIPHVMRRYDWDLLVMKWHDTDTFQHTAFHMIDPVHPLFDPAHEAEGWEHFREVYGLGDRLVGAILDQADDDTIVAVVSDHGQIANTYSPDINRALEAEGLCARTESGKIDLPRCKVLAATTGIHINLKGRYEGGTVEPGEEYEMLRRKVLGMMKEMKHPHTGEPAFHLVAYTEDLAFMGLGGPHMGDIVYMINPIVPNRRYNEEEYEQLVMSGTWLTSRGTHGAHLPSQKFSLGGIEGIALLAGPGVRPGRRTTPVWANAIAPTLSYLSGLPMPRDADGAIILGCAEL